MHRRRGARQRHRPVRSQLEAGRLRPGAEPRPGSGEHACSRRRADKSGAAEHDGQHVVRNPGRVDHGRRVRLRVRRQSVRPVLGLRLLRRRPGRERAIPTSRLVVRNTLTGGIVKTITSYSPAKGELVGFGTLSDDPGPPVITSGPARLDAVDPLAPLTFTFSEPIDRATLDDVHLHRRAERQRHAVESGRRHGWNSRRTGSGRRSRPRRGSVSDRNTAFDSRASPIWPARRSWPRRCRLRPTSRSACARRRSRHAWPASAASRRRTASSESRTSRSSASRRPSRSMASRSRSW